MHKLSLLLFFVCLNQTINTADLNSNKIQYLLPVVKEQNKTISQKDTTIKRCMRHVELCCDNPKTFCTVEDPVEVEALLLEYVMKQNLTLNGNNLSHYGRPFAQQMTEAFKEDQKREIHTYISNKSGDIAELNCAHSCTTCGWCAPIILNQLLDCSPKVSLLASAICLLCSQFSIASATK